MRKTDRHLSIATILATVSLLIAGIASAQIDPLPEEDPPPVSRPPSTSVHTTPSTTSNTMDGPLTDMVFVTIPAGSFRMGSMSTEVGRDADEGPRHTVTIDSFELMTTEVTQQMWEEVMGSNPSRFVSPDRPVERVSWEDCQEFIDELNFIDPGHDYRLPTEAEWEYACRAGSTTPIYSGTMNILGLNNCPELDDIAWYGGNSGVTDISDGYDSSAWEETQYQHTRAGTHPVGTKQPNDWGLYDMLGNVYEWCEDRYHDSYDGAPEDGSAWVSGGGSNRVIRGGCWSNLARGCRSANRYGLSPGRSDGSLGFRLARSAS